MTIGIATLPFAIRYTTENRMYALVIALALAGYAVMESALVRPTFLHLGRWVYWPDCWP